MSIPFLRSHAGPPCAPEGTCACSAPLHERGGGGSLSLLIALRSRPSAGLAPPYGGGGGMSSLCLRCRCVVPPSWGGCVPPVCARGVCGGGALGAPWRSSAALLCG